MKRELNKFESSNEYIYIAYEKSFLFFNNLNKSTNDNLIKYLAKFYKNNIFKLTDENDFYLVFGSKQKMVKEQFNKIVFNGYNYFVD